MLYIRCLNLSLNLSFPRHCFLRREQYFFFHNCPVTISNKPFYRSTLLYFASYNLPFCNVLENIRSRISILYKN